MLGEKREASGWIAAGLAAQLVACGEPPPAVAIQPSILPSVASSVATPPPQAPPGLHFEIGALDTHADPCTDFYQYSCGGWMASHPIPADQSRWSRYAEMTAQNAEHERAIVEESVHADASASPAEQRVGAYYAACMDQPNIEALGLAPLKETFDRIAAIKKKGDASELLADMQLRGMDPLFSLSTNHDPHDTKKQLIWVDTGVLGLPNPADYSKTDEKAQAIRTQYRAHLEKLFQLLGDDAKTAKTAAGRVIELETRLAKKALSAVDQRSLEKRDHPMTPAELSKRFPSIDWTQFFTQLHLSELGIQAGDRVNVAEVEWLGAVDAALADPDPSAIRDYLRALVTLESSKLLPSAIEEEVFDFHQRTLRGAKENQPRWKRCLRLVDRDLGDDVGRIFVERYYKPEARKRMEGMIHALVDSYRADITSSEWLGESARKAALEKLNAMLIVTGSSNRPRSFDGLTVDRKDPLGNAWRALALESRRQLELLGKPTDRERFFDALPQETDGFGSKAMNATGFTAGFLQPPVLDPTMDDPINYGGLGSVIGHELSHRFDDEGRKYDGDGNLKSWWSEEDVKRYTDRAQCFIDEYSGFHIEDGTALNGKLTLGENIADNGGIRLSYQALKPSESGPKIDGFTPAQRFFLAWGQIRCENLTPEAMHRQVQDNEHSPGRFRVNGVVSNMPEFARAFSCQAGTPMAPAKQCRVW